MPAILTADVVEKDSETYADLERETGETAWSIATTCADLSPLVVGPSLSLDQAGLSRRKAYRTAES